MEAKNDGRCKTRDPHYWSASASGSIKTCSVTYRITSKEYVNAVIQDNRVREWICNLESERTSDREPEGLVGLGSSRKIEVP